MAVAAARQARPRSRPQIGPQSLILGVFLQQSLNESAALGVTVAHQGRCERALQVVGLGLQC
jgi:hypothetical protein